VVSFPPAARRRLPVSDVFYVQPTVVFPIDASDNRTRPSATAPVSAQCCNQSAMLCICIIVPGPRQTEYRLVRYRLAV